MQETLSVMGVLRRPQPPLSSRQARSRETPLSCCVPHDSGWLLCKPVPEEAREAGSDVSSLGSALSRVQMTPFPHPAWKAWSLSNSAAPTWDHLKNCHMLALGLQSPELPGAT